MIVTWESNFQFLHYGIEGMRWGVRRYQNEDGSLTSLGRTRYGKKAVKEYNKALKAAVSGNDKKAEKHAKKFEKIDKKMGPKAEKLAEEAERRSSYKNQKKSDTKTLSDEELKKRLDRVKVENEYNKLIQNNRQSEGKNKAKEDAIQTASSIGKTTAIALGTSLAVYFGSRAIAKGMGIQPPDYKKYDEWGEFAGYDTEKQFNDMFKFAKPKK